MRHPRILDVMRAVRVVALAHKEIRSFWYAPVRRLELAGQLAAAPSVPELEVAVEPQASASPDFDAIARELTALLRPAVVAVRAYRGDGEERHLFRLISWDEAYEQRQRGGEP